jgi:hypothetical protein
MGAFFGSIQIRSEDQDAVKTAVEDVARELKRKFLVGPAIKGWIAVYPDESGQDDTCAIALAKRINTILLQLIVHDDDIFIYNLFRKGELLNEYSSKPDYFEEVSEEERERLKPKLESFRDLISSARTLEKISRLLGATEKTPEFVLEHERLSQFANLLGIHNTLTSYDYLMAGERAGVRDWKKFIHVPDLSAEKTARREAATALRREKLRLRRTGHLCNEWLPPCGRQDAIFSQPDFCADPLNGGFLVLWRRIVGYGYPPQLHRLQPPWEAKPSTVELTYPSTSPEGLMMSPGGSWLAFWDRRLQLWDWRRRQMINETQLNAAPVAFTRDEKVLFCQAAEIHKQPQIFTLITPETGQVVHTIKPGLGCGEVLTVDFSNKYVVARCSEDQFGIIGMETGKLCKVLFSEVNPEAPDFMTAVEEARRLGLTDGTQHYGLARGTPKLMTAKFSPDGRFLFCATTLGLRVYNWIELLASTGNTPTPLYSMTPVPEAVRLDLIHYDNIIYNIILDEIKDRLLFAGRQGLIRFLNLNDGSMGILLNPPGKTPICRLQLSHDREFICCHCIPSSDDRNKKPSRLQVWNYGALCKAVGLD